MVIKTKDLFEKFNKNLKKGQKLFDEMTLEQQFDVVIDFLDNYDFTTNANVKSFMISKKTKKMLICIREVNKKDYHKDIIVFINHVIEQFMKKHPEEIRKKDRRIEDEVIVIPLKRNYLLIR